MTSVSNAVLIALPESLLGLQAQLFHHLRQNGIPAIAITYEGSGGDRTENQIEAPNQSIDLDDLIIVANDEPTSVGELIDSFTDALLQELYPEFDDEFGGSGTIRLTTATGGVEIEHSDHSEREFDRDNYDSSVAETFSQALFNPENRLRFKPTDIDSVVDAARAQGLVTIQVDYSGSGDEGDAFDIWTFDTQGKEIDLSTVIVQELPEYFRSFGAPMPGADAIVDESGQGWVARAGERKPKVLLDVLEDILATVINELHPGYENNSGGSGNLHLNFAAGSVRLESKNISTDSSTIKSAFMSAEDGFVQLAAARAPDAVSRPRG